jgi:hypothetical protein
VKATFRGGVDRDVAFADADHTVGNQIDSAYRSKYHRYAKSITDSITSPGPALFAPLAPGRAAEGVPKLRSALAVLRSTIRATRRSAVAIVR